MCDLEYISVISFNMPSVMTFQIAKGRIVSVETTVTMNKVIDSFLSGKKKKKASAFHSFLGEHTCTPKFPLEAQVFFTFNAHLTFPKSLAMALSQKENICYVESWVLIIL